MLHKTQWTRNPKRDTVNAERVATMAVPVDMLFGYSRGVKLTRLFLLIFYPSHCPKLPFGLVPSSYAGTLRHTHTSKTPASCFGNLAPGSVWSIIVVFFWFSPWSKHERTEAKRDCAKNQGPKKEPQLPLPSPCPALNLHKTIFLLSPSLSLLFPLSQATA